MTKVLKDEIIYKININVMLCRRPVAEVLHYCVRQYLEI